MALNVGGFGVSFTMSSFGVALHFTFKGPLWESFVKFAKKMRGTAPQDEDGEAQKNPSESNDQAGKLPTSNTSSEILRQINSVSWYHTLDFGNGIKTPGSFDHAPLLAQYKLPARLDGKRVLDVATFDGFWAFEFEKRGAKEVFALDLDRPADLDWPPKRRAQITDTEKAARFGGGFEIAKNHLNSSVQRVVCNVYDLSPEKFGMFDVVHSGDFLIHLSNPVKALQNMANVCTEYALISDACFPDLDAVGVGPILIYHGGRDNPTWWWPSVKALENMILDAGFTRVEMLNRFTHGYRVKPGRWQHCVFKAYK